MSHQLFVVAVRDNMLALCASDGAMRDRVVKALTVARKLPRAAIPAFVGQCLGTPTYSVPGGDLRHKGRARVHFIICNPAKTHRECIQLVRVDCKLS